MGVIRFYVYNWFFIFLLSVFMVISILVLIIPLFNKYNPPKNSDPKDWIYGLKQLLISKGRFYDYSVGGTIQSTRWCT